MPILNTPDFIFHNALDFFELGKQRTKEIFKEDPLKNPFLWYHISAPAVNLAFSLELMLKTILLLEKGTIHQGDKSHNLKALFLKATPEAQSKIIENFTLNHDNRIKYPAFRFANEDFSNSKKSISNDPKTTKEKIFKLLSNHDNSFVSWRYSFELSNIDSKVEAIDFDFGDMIHLIETTSNYIKGIFESESKGGL